MKKFIISFLMLTAVVSADSAGRSCGMYLSGNAGANWAPESSSNYHARTKAGYFLSGAIGIKNIYNFRSEIEVSYRRNFVRLDVVGTDNTGLITAYRTSGRTELQAAMLNAYYDIDLWEGWTPYIGGGYGIAKQRVISEGISGRTVQTTKDIKANQLMGGLLIRVFYNTDLGLEYRNFKAEHLAREHSVSLTLRRFF